MEVRILEAGGNLLRFYVSGVETKVANALRRVMVAEVPTMAIDDIVIVENTSPIRDESLAHRIGLIPLKTDFESYIPRELCDCHSELGCGRCSVTLTLEADAPDGKRTVYSRELKSGDPDVVPVSDDIPIAKLARGQVVRLEAYARLGTGREHAKWQPINVSAYKYAVVLKVNPKECDLCERCAKACPRQILRVEGTKLVLLDYEGCDLCQICSDACHKDALEVAQEKDALIFTVESTGALPPEKIVGKAIEVLINKTKELMEQVSKLKEEEAK